MEGRHERRHGSVDMAVVEEFDYLCRLCATKTGILMGLPIFEAGDQMRNIDKKIAACLPVQVRATSERRADSGFNLPMGF